jgi:hypothetical protein
VNAPQRRRIPGPTPELIYMTHEQAVLVAAELMDAHDEEERRQASL